jgi:polyisoprenoid-binding protein YceI
MKMKNTIIILLISIQGLFTSQALGQEMNFDTNSSKIKWYGKEFSGKQHYGSLYLTKAEIKMKDGLISGGTFVVDMESLNVQDLTGEWKEKLQGHLRSDDFFSVEKFNTAKLIIEKSKLLKEGTYEINGQLTIKEITLPTTFKLYINDNGAEAKMIFDRSKYDVRFRSGNFFENLGDKLIYDDIEMDVTLNLTK